MKLISLFLSTLGMALCCHADTTEDFDKALSELKAEGSAYHFTWGRSYIGTWLYGMSGEASKAIAKTLGEDEQKRSEQLLVSMLKPELTAICHGLLLHIYQDQLHPTYNWGDARVRFMWDWTKTNEHIKLNNLPKPTPEQAKSARDFWIEFLKNKKNQNNGANQPLIKSDNQQK